MSRGHAWTAPARQQPQMSASAMPMPMPMPMQTFSIPSAPPLPARLPLAPAFGPPRAGPPRLPSPPAFARQSPPPFPSHPHLSRPHPARPHPRPLPLNEADIPPRQLTAQPHTAHPAARQHAWQRRLDAAHAALLADLEAIGDDEGRRRLRIEAHNDLVYRWSWEREVNPGPGGGARL